MNRSRGSRRKAWLLTAGLALLVWVLSGFLLRALNSGEILDGTSMGGVALGDQTRAQAAELIAEIESQTVELSGPAEPSRSERRRPAW